MPRLTVRKVEGNNANIDIGAPLPGVELMIGEKELLLFKSPYRAVAWIYDDGYHEVMDDQWVQTGDKAYFEDTGVLKLLGRAQEVFKRYGEKISLHHLAKTVAANWHGQQAFYKETDNAGEEGYVLILSPEPASDQVRSILKAFRNSWPRTHWPLRIESFAKLPLLTNSKVNIQALSKLKNVKIHWEQRI
jgi:long-subunit acyl-CoA synthetase (AMP-forming)